MAGSLNTTGQTTNSVVYKRRVRSLGKMAETIATGEIAPIIKPQRRARPTRHGKEPSQPHKIKLVQLPTGANSFSMLMPPRQDVLLDAKFMPPSGLALRFSDGFVKDLHVKALGMPVDRIRWPTVRVTTRGGRLSVKAKQGELITVEASTLRYLADKNYAAKMDAEYEELRLSGSELLDLSSQMKPPAELRSEPPEDLILDSWK